MMTLGNARTLDVGRLDGNKETKWPDPSAYSVRAVSPCPEGGDGKLAKKGTRRNERDGRTAAAGGGEK